MRLYKCQYSDGSELGRKLQEVYEQLRSLSEGRIDGRNLSRTQLLGDGLEYVEQIEPLPPKVYNSFANQNEGSYLKLKEDAGDPAERKGIEAYVDSSDSTYGKFCICASNDTDAGQLISIYPENPESVASPGGYIDFNSGVGRLRTTSDNNLILSRNSVVNLELKSTTAEWSLTNTPAATNTYDLGTSSLGWKEIYTRIVDTDGAQSLLLQRNNVTQFTFDGTSIISNDKPIKATTTATADLGTSAVAWSKVYCRNIDTDGAQTLRIQRNNTTFLSCDGSIIATALTVRPDNTNEDDLGTSALAYKELYVRTIDTDGAQTLSLQTNNTTRIAIDGTGIGFFATAPVAQSTGWAVTNVTPDKVFDANSTSVDELADVLGTLITYLISRGDLSA